jgi:hypothetical protein
LGVRAIAEGFGLAPDMSAKLIAVTARDRHVFGNVRRARHR